MAYQTFLQEYMQIPIVTRIYTTACVITTLAVVGVNVLKHSAYIFRWFQLRHIGAPTRGLINLNNCIVCVRTRGSFFLPTSVTIFSHQIVGHYVSQQMQMICYRRKKNDLFLKCLICVNHFRFAAFGHCVTISTIFQPDTNTEALSAMEAGHNVLVFRNHWL